MLAARDHRSRVRNLAAFSTGTTAVGPVLALTATNRSRFDNTMADDWLFIGLVLVSTATLFFADEVVGLVGRYRRSPDIRRSQLEQVENSEPEQRRPAA
jgi:hypothetical protein